MKTIEPLSPTAPEAPTQYRIHQLHPKDRVAVLKQLSDVHAGVMERRDAELWKLTYEMRKLVDGLTGDSKHKFGRLVDQMQETLL